MEKITFGIEAFIKPLEEIQKMKRTPVKIRINQVLLDKILSDHVIVLQSYHVACLWGIPFVVDETVIGYEIDYE